jgi:hypothetical protein
VHAHNLLVRSKVPLEQKRTTHVSHDDDESLDDEFPEGDGTAQTEATVICPYCAEEVEIAIDPGSGPSQMYVEDCEICCQPWRVAVSYDEAGQAEVVVTVLDE